jgi:fructose-specific phosphotransferase system IIC component
MLTVRYAAVAAADKPGLPAGFVRPAPAARTGRRFGFVGENGKGGVFDIEIDRGV